MKVVVALSCAVLLAAVTARAEPPPTSCVACHGSADHFSEKQVQMVRQFDEDAHAKAGLSCQDCHGGNPDPALTGNKTAAMDPTYAANPYHGVPERTDIPNFCGRCHSDIAYMKKFSSSPRVDQEREYWTSDHGKGLKRGDPKVATCVDCHGAHDILPPDNTASRVYPTHVAETCARCHADAEYMRGYKLPDGRPLPVDQYARWERSVHARALLDHEELSAPTCNDCHGNHAAAPPGIESVALVCGNCHGREAELFRASPKREGFARHRELLATAGDEGCAMCHPSTDPASHLPSSVALTECAACHGEHGIVRPVLSMLSPLPAAPCVFCHEPSDANVQEIPDLARTRRRYQKMRDELLARASEQGLRGEDRFNWLIDQAMALPYHTQPGAEGGTQMRPEFQRLFTKFRIGKTYYTYRDPSTGQEVRAPVLRCGNCHAQQPALTGEAVGYGTSKTFVDRMQNLTALTARAERLLLAAQRGGVTVREPASEIDQAVDAQIQLEVLVHTFSDADSGEFIKHYEEGRKHAEAALNGARKGLDELAYRRRGLFVSLGLIVLVLIALGLKIRALGSPRP